MQRRTVLFLSLAAGLALIVAFLLSLGDVAPPVGARPPEPAAAPPPTRQDPPPPAAGAVRVRVEVVSKERYVAPAPVRVQAVHAVGGAGLPTALLAGTGAGFDATLHGAGAALVAIEHEEGRVLRQVALQAGEVAQVVLGARLVVRGRVVGADRKPVAGSVVWFGEFDAAGHRREVVPDEEGQFTAEVLAGAGVPFVVTAAGHASAWRVVEVAAPMPRCDAELQRGCSLEVQIAATAIAMHEARVFVVPRPSVTTGVAHWPFFTQALLDGFEVDATGRAVVDGLPATGEVGLVVRHPRAGLAAPQAVVLKGARARAVVPLQFAKDTWQGLVVDDVGQGLPGVAVFARAAGGALDPGSSQRLVPPNLEERGAFVAISDASGAFTIGAPGGGSATVSLRRLGHAGRDILWADVVAGQGLVLPAWRGGQAELRLSPPKAGVPWIAEADLAAGVRDAVAADEVFRVALPHEGRFDFVLTTFVGDEVRGRERHDDLHVTGPLELQPPRLP